MNHLLFNYNLLRLYSISIDEAQNIDPGCHPAGTDTIYRVSQNNDASRHVNHLQGSLAVDNDVAVTDKCETPLVTVTAKDVLNASTVDQHGTDHPSKIDGEVGIDIPAVAPQAEMVP